MRVFILIILFPFISCTPEESEDVKVIPSEWSIVCDNSIGEKVSGYDFNSNQVICSRNCYDIVAVLKKISLFDRAYACSVAPQRTYEYSENYREICEANEGEYLECLGKKGSGGCGTSLNHFICSLDLDIRTVEGFTSDGVGKQCQAPKDAMVCQKISTLSPAQQSFKLECEEAGFQSWNCGCSGEILCSEKN